MSRARCRIRSLPGRELTHSLSGTAMYSDSRTPRALHRTGSGDADIVTQAVPRSVSRNDAQRRHESIPISATDYHETIVDEGTALDQHRLRVAALRELSATRQTVSSLRHEVRAAHEQLHLARIEAEAALAAQRYAQAQLAQTMAGSGARVDAALQSVREHAIRWRRGARRRLAGAASALRRNRVMRAATRRVLPAPWRAAIRRGLARGAGRP